MPSACRRVEPQGKPSFDLREADASTRPQLERFIARRFAEVYDARLYSFMPRLFGLYCTDGQLHAAFGLRAASAQPLFLERYLDAPIEAYVAERSDAPASRRRIVEVGNLAGATPGAVRELIVLLSDRLFDEGFHWVAFTGSAGLCNSFSRMGLPLSVIASAPVERLRPEERQYWGRYYDKSPSVMLGDVAGGRRQLHSSSGHGDSVDVFALLNGVGAP